MKEQMLIDRIENTLCEQVYIIVATMDIKNNNLKMFKTTKTTISVYTSRFSTEYKVQIFFLS